MNKEIDFQELFLSKLDRISENHAKKVQDLKTAGAFDESVLCKIQMNIVGVFRGVFLFCTGNKVRGFNEETRKILQEYPKPPEKTFHLYLYYLEMIPRTWKQALADAQLHDDVVAATKERVKFFVVDEIQTCFHRTYHEFWGDPK